MVCAKSNVVGNWRRWKDATDDEEEEDEDDEGGGSGGDEKRRECRQADQTRVCAVYSLSNCNLLFEVEVCGGSVGRI